MRKSKNLLVGRFRNWKTVTTVSSNEFSRPEICIEFNRTLLDTILDFVKMPRPMSVTYVLDTTSLWWYEKESQDVVDCFKTQKLLDYLLRSYGR